MAKVELGFLEKADCPEELTSPYYPSKVGGKPAWLDPIHLPTPEETACSVCGAPRTFLLQVYAPPPDIPSAFHRSFFLFLCLNSSCHRRNSAGGFRVFRCQLPKKNAFYEEECLMKEGDSKHSRDESTIDMCCDGGEHKEGSDSPSDSPTCDKTHAHTDAVCCDSAAIDEALSSLTLSEQQESTKPTVLCVVCGSAGPKKCSRCRMVSYCSKHHQTHDWKNGHKLFCADLATGKCKLNHQTFDSSYGVCLPEFVLITEEEPVVQVCGVGERGDEERMREYHDFIKSSKYHDHSNKSEKQVKRVMEKAESDATSDKVFNAFRRRVAVEPEQVVRYQRGGLPLLVSQDNAPQVTDIPPCVCGADRQFEFQVMPQLLYYLKLDALSEASVDWGTLIVYSCTESCNISKCRYTTDVVWKQDFSNTPK